MKLIKMVEYDLEVWLQLRGKLFCRIKALNLVLQF